MDSETLPPIPEAHPARPLVTRLINAGYSPEQISRLMDERVSARTIYRWASGGSDPQNPKDLAKLRDLVEKLTPKKKKSA